MITNVRLEKGDTNVEEATVARWLVEVGQAVEVGSPLVEIITDKATVEGPSPAAGTVRSLLVAAGSSVPVGTILAQIGEADEPLPDVSAVNEALRGAHLARLAVTIATDQDEPRPERHARPAPVRALPVARRLARELGVDLARVTPTGNGGLITEEDVRRAADQGD